MKMCSVQKSVLPREGGGFYIDISVRLMERQCMFFIVFMTHLFAFHYECWFSFSTRRLYQSTSHPAGTSAPPSPFELVRIGVSPQSVLGGGGGTGAAQVAVYYTSTALPSFSFERLEREGRQERREGVGANLWREVTDKQQIFSILIYTISTVP